MDNDIVQQVRAIASELGARGTQPGFVAGGTKERVAKLNSELVALFNVEQDVSTFKRRAYKKDPVTGKNVQDAHKDPETGKVTYWDALFETDEVMIDRQATAKGNILRAMIQHLMAAGFGTRSHSPDEHESRILAAVKALPELAAQLELKPVPEVTTNEWVRRRSDLGETVEDQMAVLYKNDTRMADRKSPEIAEILGCTPQAIRKEDNKVWKFFQEEKGRRKTLLSQKIRPTKRESDDDDD